MVAKFINVVNVHSDIGSVFAGKSKAPAALKSQGLQAKLRAIEYEIEEQDAFADSPAVWMSSNREPNGARDEARTVEACRKVSKTIASALTGTERPPFQLILAGECLYCPAIMSAYWHRLSHSSKKVGIIYVDADCDLHTPTEPGSSGNIAGMTLTHLTLREGALDSMSTLSRPDGTGVVDNDNIVLFGLNIDSEANKRDHLGYLFDNDFRVFTSRTIQRNPIDNAKVALSWLEERVDYIIVHLDVDVIDPGQFPLCNVPSWTGLGFEETMAAVKVFLKSDKTVALSVAEVNPDHDPGLKMTKSLVDKIVDAFK